MVDLGSKGKCNLCLERKDIACVIRVSLIPEEMRESLGNPLIPFNLCVSCGNDFYEFIGKGRPFSPRESLSGRKRPRCLTYEKLYRTIMESGGKA